ncbi:hypothetical protein SARC_08482 [Sphaeroforma arctica JP610]|uniref:Uncharacterized protein n=1 Tax=Sphaeroforma arctica JP610 TaxID=667725 RepID=A0A0L0FQS9_9EUKA|nr:hypothetical protein SARC_08482 [Sphaeroforma arctica JP610]KNC79115.1 hypothetical protein SARC_08482 [Sphaeroforma arctica JP610]|eukprot:XP_014153017.1 hypothetical protein SARC_08482 [Sphaeroforma arctica JP610]
MSLNAADRHQSVMAVPRSSEHLDDNEGALDEFVRTGGSSDVRFSRPYALTHIVYELRHVIKDEGLLAKYLSSHPAPVMMEEHHGDMEDTSLAFSQYIQVSEPTRLLRPMTCNPVYLDKVPQNNSVRHVNSYAFTEDLTRYLPGVDSIESLTFTFKVRNMHLLSKFPQLKALCVCQNGHDLEQLPPSVLFLRVPELPDRVPQNAKNLRLVETHKPVDASTQAVWRRVSPNIKFMVRQIFEEDEHKTRILDNNVDWYQHSEFKRTVMKYLKFPLHFEF